MVLKYLQDYFDLEDSVNGFIKFINCVPMWPLATSLGFVASRLLPLAKISSGICPIVMGEMFYQLMNKVLCL